MTRARSRCCRRCARPPDGRRGHTVDRRGAAGSRRRARAGPGHAVRARRDGGGRGGDRHPPRRSRDRRRVGARIRLRRIRRRTRDTRTGRAVVDGVFAARRPGDRPHRTSARPSTSCGWRCVPRPTRSPPSGSDQPAPTSTIRAEWSSSCWNPRGTTRFPSTPDARAAGAGERRPRRRDHHGQRRAEQNRHAVVVGGADRHRRAAAAGRVSCDRRGWLRSARSCTLPGSVSSGSRFSAAQCGGRHGSPLTPAAQPGTGSGPSPVRARGRGAARRSDPPQAGRIAGRRWACSPARTRYRPRRSVARNSLSRSHTTSMWSATNPIGQTMTAFVPLAASAGNVIGDVGFQPRHLRRTRARLPDHVVVVVAGGRRDKPVRRNALGGCRAWGRRRSSAAIGTECAVKISRASAGTVCARRRRGCRRTSRRTADGRSSAAV